VRHVLVLVAVAASAATLAGCGGSTEQAAPTTVTVTMPAQTLTETVTASAEPQPAAPVGEFPKIVSRNEIDPRYVTYDDAAEFVMLAPGVYAEIPADGVLGTLSDYSSYFGECTAIHRYSEQYPGGSTCW
jgi:hypothetical protein